ncbi:MAG: dehydrogenase [Bacteroidales bacterium]|nr:dehydrogenase [Bacteroidales bacterium]
MARPYRILLLYVLMPAVALFAQTPQVVIDVVCDSSCYVTPPRPHNTKPLPKAPKKVLNPLPDTFCYSAYDLYWKITVHDTAVSGEVDDLTDLYSLTEDILMFRGNAFRSTPFVGSVAGYPDTLIIDWTFNTGYDSRPSGFGSWGGGNGWTGQPLFVRWSDSLYNRFLSEPKNLTKNFARDEIIVASLCSRLYFINFETGDSSRRSIFLGNPIKGTPSIDPTYNGNIYIGQGVPCQRPFGALVVNLFKHKRTHFERQDNKAWRDWGAYDSSPIRVGNFLFRPGENGTLYKYRIIGDSLKLHTTMRYTMRYRNMKFESAGMEASMAVYRNYGYIADNFGDVLCVNLNTMKPVWHYYNYDDTDGSLVLQWEDDGLFLYTGCEVDHQGAKGLCYFVKLDALTGKRVWQQTFACNKVSMGEKHFDGGMYSTPLPGVGNCKDLIFFNLVTNDGPGMKGDFVAVRRSDGEVVYRTQLQHYAWSSPVAMLNEYGDMFVITFDTQGRVYLIDAFSGEILMCKKIGLNFEASPIVVGNSVVIGSRGRTIYKMTFKQNPYVNNSNSKYDW